VTTTGTVRTWDDDEGWGVVDSADTPGGCWTHFGQVDAPGLRRLRPGAAVELEWEPAQQDGFSFVAVAVRPLPDIP
jgi:cold shock protein